MPWVLPALLSAFFAGLVTIFAKAGVRNMDPTLATTIRTIIMAFLLVAVSALFKKFETAGNIGGREVAFLILSGIAGALSLLFYFAALKIGDAGKVAVIDRLSLVFIAILSVILFKEKIDARGVVGIILVVIGAVMVSWK